MRVNNIGIGILIAAVAAVVLAIGMFVGRRMEDENENYRGQDKPALSENNNDSTDMISGDINDDGMINTADLTVFAEYLNNRKKMSVKNADMNSDAKTDEKDFEILKSMF